jgi:Protein of unknown function (DUF3592)
MKYPHPFLILMFALFGLAAVFFVSKGTEQWIREYRIERDYLTSSGSVTRLNPMAYSDTILYAPVITYMTQDSQVIEYHSDHYCNNHDYVIGKKFSLWYDPKDPQKISYDHGGRFMIVYIAVFALLLGGVGFGGLYYQYQIYRKGARLAKHGVLIETTFLKIVDYYWIHGRPKMIVSTWTDPKTRIPYEFESHYFYGDLPTFDQNTPIMVRIDPQNPVIHRMEGL